MTNGNHHDANPSLSGTDGLIPVFNADIGGILQAAVDARELYLFLGVKRDFSTWIKRRLKDYGLVENQDYSQVIDSKAHQNGGAVKSSTYGQDKIDYHLTLDVAKELAMVEKNERGREARRYFIACERRMMAALLAKSDPLPEGSPSVPEAEAEGVFPGQYDWIVILMLIHSRSLFLFCREYVPCLSDPALPPAELKVRWKALEAYFNQLVDKLTDGIDQVAAETQGSMKAKKRAVIAYIRQWHPHPGIRFAEFGKRRD